MSRRTHSSRAGRGDAFAPAGLSWPLRCARRLAQALIVATLVGATVRTIVEVTR